MANRIKYNSGIDADSLNIGNWSVGLPNGMGPTATTEFQNGAEIPTGGYAIYSQGVNVRIAANDTELLNILNKLGASVPMDDVYSALKWASINNVLVVNDVFDNISTSGLVLNLDAKHRASYHNNTPTINVLSSGDPDLNNNIIWTNSGSWAFDDNITDIDKPFNYGSDGLKIMRGITYTAGSQHIGCASFNGPASTTYTISVFFRQSRAGSNQPYFRTKVNNNSLGNFNYNGDTSSANWPVNTWIRISCTATLQSNETGGYLSNYIGRAIDDKVWYFAPQVELGSVMTPFIHGTRLQNSEWVDTSGMSNNGILLGDPQLDTDNNLVFDGAGDHVQINSHSAFTVDSRTIEITFKMNGAYSDLTPIAVYANGSSSTNRIWLGIQNSRFRMHGWGTSDPQGSTAINADQWYTCVFSYDKPSQQMKVYTNGKLESTSTNDQSGVTASAGMNWYLAAVPGGWQGNTYSDITFKSFKVYDRILSDAEVAHNFYSGPIVTNGLATAFDSKNKVSYVEGQGNGIKNLAGTTAITLNNAIFNSERETFVLDGSDDFIVVSDPNLTNASGATLDIWFKMNQFNTSHGNRTYLVDPRGNGNTSGTSMYFLFDHESGDYVHFVSGCGNVEVQSPSTYLPLNTWHHAVVTIDDDANTIIYLNGKIIKSGIANPSTSLAFSNTYRVGTYAGASGAAYMLNGEISNYKMYTRPLSQDEVLQNYNAHVARFK